MTIPMGLKKMFGIVPTNQPAGQDSFVAALHAHFDGQIGAFAYLLFILLYFPCIATTAAAYRESSLAWSAFMVLWSTALAYFSAVLFYQLATFREHPVPSTLWLVVIIAIGFATLQGFRYLGRRPNGI
ncbi:MAG: nucleoside recognition domain-containing protein [Methylomonas sp.]|nr:nucleoside recognition domain-containing protein [Methylomonas sp.]